MTCRGPNSVQARHEARCEARHGKARQGKASSKARQGKARQGVHSLSLPPRFACFFVFCSENLRGGKIAPSGRAVTSRPTASRAPTPHHARTHARTHACMHDARLRGATLSKPLPPQRRLDDSRGVRGHGRVHFDRRMPFAIGGETGKTKQKREADDFRKE